MYFVNSFISIVSFPFLLFVNAGECFRINFRIYLLHITDIIVAIVRDQKINSSCEINMIFVLFKKPINNTGTKDIPTYSIKFNITVMNGILYFKTRYTTAIGAVKI